ncbi:MAG TPA: cyclic nucleotide-binding domain-containing protein [Polyangiaceae bacterium LLY-WYZ-15_(1-7)]|nr:cyclic nucleotide-binding domain-containing protein [Polyangiaceae bacterium LLY-WYZ-15_(1-7)]
MASVRRLRSKLNDAIRKGKKAQALELYAALEEAEPTEPRWPHRRGDLLRRMDRDQGAIGCYMRAVRAYAELGFVARAAALAKLIVSIDPSRIDVLARDDPEAARRLHRAQRTSVAEARPDDVEAPRAARGESAAADDDAAPPRERRRKSFEADAIALAPAADADDDEVRFVDVAEDDDGIEIEITELELEPREAPARTTLELDADDLLILEEDEEPARPAADRLAQLPAMPLFAELPKDVFKRLLELSELVEVPAGETLVAAGDPSDALYVLTEGSVSVHVPGRAGPPILLGEGDVVGESCLLDDVARRADVRVPAGGVRALKLPKAMLDALVTAYPPLGDLLLELLARRLISNLLVTSPLFAGFAPETRKELASLFELRRAEEGTRLVAKGKRSDALYCLLLGKLEVETPEDVRVEVGPGAVLGQRTLLTQAPSEVEVDCKSDALLLRLPAARFTELAALYPTALAYLSELATQPDFVESVLR